MGCSQSWNIDHSSQEKYKDKDNDKDKDKDNVWSGSQWAARSGGKLDQDQFNPGIDHSSHKKGCSTNSTEHTRRMKTRFEK